MIYDCIVLGVGGVGSFAFYEAARQGWKTLGIERFGPAHDKGSSHGRTRIIRTAYFEHPNYVPLARRAWEKWLGLQAQTDTKLVQRTGLLQVGNPNGEVIQGVMRSASEHDISIENWLPEEAMQRFPALNLDQDSVCLFEENAGYLMIENCVAHAIRLGLDAGGTLQNNTVVDQITVESDRIISVRAGDDQFQTRRLIVCAGPWSAQFVEKFGIDIEIIRKQQNWFQLDRIDIKQENGFPCFLIETENGCFYGFPEIDYLSMKVAEHSGGQRIISPSEVNRDCVLDDLQKTEAFLDASFHFTRRRMVHHSVCMYSMSRDGHFIVDRHPDTSAIVFAAGMSGHGYKFAPLLGERLVGLLESEEDSMFDFLRIGDRKLRVP